MGSRVVLPIVAVVLVLAGVGIWLFGGDEEGGAAGPAAAVPVADGELEESADLATPTSTAGETTTQRKVAPKSVPTEPEAVAKPTESATPMVKGRLVDKLGNPISNASVGLRNGLIFDFDPRGTAGVNDDETTTGADGRFALEMDASTSKLLFARASGFAPLPPKEVHMPGSGSVELGNLTLSQGALLSGHVYDANGRPVEGAKILNSHREGSGFLMSENLLSNSSEPLAITAQDGSFRIESLACGTWNFLVTAEDHPSLKVDGVADIPGVEVSGLEFQFGEAGIIAGRLTEIPESSNERLSVRARLVDRRAGGMLSFQPAGMRQVECAADGSFELRGLKGGQAYELQARATTNATHGFQIFGGGIRSDSVEAQTGDQGVELFYSSGGGLSFQVVDADTNQPVTSMLVSSGVRFPVPVRDDAGSPKREFPDGLVEISGIYPRNGKETVRLKVEATGYRSMEENGIDFVIGDTLDLGVIRLEPSPVLVVNVTDAKSGVPVTGASVSLSPAPEESPEGEMRFEMNVSIGDDDHGHDAGPMFAQSNRTTTDEFGVATLNSFEGQECLLRVESEGHAPQEVRLFMPKGERIEEDVALRQGGSVVVTAVDPNGDPMSGVKVEHRDPSSGPQVAWFGGGQSAKGRTDAEGQVTFAHLEPGLHSFRIKEAGSGPSGGFMGDGEAVVMMAGMGGGNDDAWVDIEVTEGSKGELLLEASPMGILEGRVREGGIPLAGATLKLKQPSTGMPGGFDPGEMFGGGGPSARTDGEGYYSFENVKPGEYKLTISHPTRALPTERELEIRERGGKVQENLDVDLSIAVIEGRITDAAGDPISNIEVWAERAGGSQMGLMNIVVMDDDTGGSMSFGDEAGDGRARTDADGYYSLRGVPIDAELTVHASAASFEESTSEPVTVREDGVRGGVDMVMNAAGKLEFSVLKADGSPAGMCMLTAEYQGQGNVEPKQSFVERGKGTVSGLRPGPWMLSLRALGPGGGGGGGGEGELVEIVAGETKTITLDAP